MKFKNKYGLLAFAIFSSIILLSLCSFVSALSIGALGDGAEITLYPGQVLERSVTIQNLLDSAQDVVLKGQVELGSEILSLVGSTRYEVPAGSIVYVPIRFEVPQNAPVGTTYPMLLMFRTISGGEEGGSVSFVENIGKQFTVRVVEKPANVVEQKSTANTNVWLWVIVIIVIVLLLWWLMKKRRK